MLYYKTNLINGMHNRCAHNRTGHCRRRTITDFIIEVNNEICKQALRLAQLTRTSDDTRLTEIHCIVPVTRFNTQMWRVSRRNVFLASRWLCVKSIFQAQYSTTRIALSVALNTY